MELLDPEASNADALARLRTMLDERTAGARDSRYAQALRDNDGVQRLVHGDWPLQWSAKYQFVSDDPAKVTMQKRDESRAAVGAALCADDRAIPRTHCRSFRLTSCPAMPAAPGSSSA